MNVALPLAELGRTPTLRCAVLTDAVAPRRWHVQCVERLSAQQDACVVLLRVASALPGQARTRGPFGPPRRSLMLADADWSSVQGPQYDIEAHETAAHLAEHDVDFVLDLRENDPPEIDFDIPVHGVWRFSFPSHPSQTAPLALIHGHATVPAGLVACTPDGGVQCLVEGTYGVVPTSETRTTDRVLGAASGFPARASRAIRLRLPPANRPYDSRSTTVGHGPLPRIRLALTLLIRRGRKAVRDAFTESYWSVGAVKVPVESVMDGSVTGELIDWYPTADADTYVADPFPLPSDSRAVYVEEFDHMTRHGRLAVMTYSEEEGWSNTRVVADEVFHMSYPYMFEYEGETLCVPESGWNNAVSIYRAQHPRPLEKACDILTGLAAGDPTVFWWDGHWWIFYTDCLEPRDTDLYIFYSSSPWGPWQPHLRNPVKSDISSSRPAGAPFVRDGRLLRPAQDDAGRYGWRMVVNEVLKLTPREFEETLVTRIGPFGSGPFPIGPHTLSVAGPYVYVDGKRSVVSLSLKARRLLRSMRSRFVGRRDSMPGGQ
ncbi:hypothetical protein OG333_37770 (plasmid) [Streptomyces anulatus]|uniref:glucosamine inositolphosphorylceramide transferase family protein n=1 Tax=Streptomyces anulatus TaxID=1892 RepID=UPI00386E9585|nr:hypothetical protein OG333_37770 [Streptomyces anulatus]